MSSPLKQILVHVDATRSAPLRLAAARQVAQAHGAALSALYASVPVYLALPYVPDIAAGATLVEGENERRAAARKLFDDTMATPGPVATWASTNDMPMAAAFAQQALYADLLVLGQHDAGDQAAVAVPPDFAESVLLATGRPGLLIPFAGFSGFRSENIAIAWKPTREALRAVMAALPFLQQAAHVHVLCWGEDRGIELEGHRMDLDGYLRLHGVQPTWHHGGPEPHELGDILLSRTYDLGVDLLVMGCYGHSRMREWVLGGTSRSVLRSMTVPVLMVH